MKSVAILKRIKPKKWWQNPQYEYEDVTVIAVGSRHVGSYAATSWDYNDVLISNSRGEKEEVKSSDLFWKE